MDMESDTSKYYSKLYIGPSDKEGEGLSPINKKVFFLTVSHDNLFIIPIFLQNYNELECIISVYKNKPLDQWLEDTKVGGIPVL